MVQINFAQKTVNVKIVYYGPGMSGKTTNLEVVHQRAPDANRGELTSISTDGDRTLFFDYMPLDLGTVAGMRTSFQLYTVPGQVYYNSTRKLVLQGVDGIIFIADSSTSMLDQNLESLRNLEENLNEYGKSLKTLPHVLQWNKRDLPDAMSAAELEKHLNLHGAQTFEAIASSGQGVFPTLKALAATVLRGILEESAGGKAGASAAAAAPATPAAAPQPQLDVAAPVAPSAPAQPAAPAAHAPAPAPVAHQQTAQPMARPVAQQVAHQPATHSGPSGLMKNPAPRPSQGRPKGARVRAAKQSGARRSRPRAQAASKQKSKKSSVGLFITVAGVLGAAIAWAVQNYVL